MRTSTLLLEPKPPIRIRSLLILVIETVVRFSKLEKIACSRGMATRVWCLWEEREREREREPFLDSEEVAGEPDPEEKDVVSSGLRVIQRYLAQKKTPPPPRTLQWPYAYGPMVVPGGGSFLMIEVPL
jgi:hypothetical protein